ncbi:MAG: FadR family transcriptional regulator [Rubrivivax sp.]|nr:FadR family transcriptional regulator [Rubrivivax sp.]
MSPRPAALSRTAILSRPRTLASELVAALSDRIRRGRLAPGHKLPTEAAVMAEFGVSRTVVREAISRLQAAGLVDTRHGVGTFVAGPGDPAAQRAFRIGPEQLATLQDVVAVLELRIGVETEAAGLAAQRRTEDNLRAMRQALAEFGAAIEAGSDAVTADFALHHEIAKATQNSHFAELLGTLGARIIPRARLDPALALSPERLVYLKRVHGEHESIVDAIAARDPDAARAAMRTHLANSRERRRREALPLVPLVPPALAQALEEPPKQGARPARAKARVPERALAPAPERVSRAPGRGKAPVPRRRA